MHVVLVACICMLSFPAVACMLHLASMLCGTSIPTSFNILLNLSLHLFYYGVTRVIFVACPHPLSCCIYTALVLCLAAYKYTALISCVAAYIYTALVSLLFGTVIPTSFNILMEMFLLPCIYMYAPRTVHTVMPYVLLILRTHSPSRQQCSSIVFSILLLTIIANIFQQLLEYTESNTTLVELGEVSPPPPQLTRQLESASVNPPNCPPPVTFCICSCKPQSHGGLLGMPCRNIFEF